MKRSFVMKFFTREWLLAITLWLSLFSFAGYTHTRAATTARPQTEEKIRSVVEKSYSHRLFEKCVVPFVPPTAGSLQARLIHYERFLKNVIAVNRRTFITSRITRAPSRFIYASRSNIGPHLLYQG